MLAITFIAICIIAFKLAELGLVVFVDGMATAIAAWYYWRRERLSHTLLAIGDLGGTSRSTPGSASRAQRLMMARHLRLSLAMTAHFSLFPRSSARGYAVARRRMAGARQGS